MKRRKYNHFKERATDFIGDNDEIVAKAKNSKGIPLDFPEGYPEDAYFAYLDAFCNGNPEYWDESAFMNRYIGDSDSPEDFIAEYYSEMIDDYFVSYDYSLFKDEIFLSKGANLKEIGWFVFRSPVGDAVWEALNPEDDEDDLETAKSQFIGDDDIDYEDTDNYGDVYITKTGKVYHTSKECSSLKARNPEVKKISLSDARKQGYKACKRCQKN